MAAGTPCLVQAQLQPVHRRQLALALALRLLCAVNRTGLFTCHHHRHRHPNIVLEAPNHARVTVSHNSRFVLLSVGCGR